MSRILSTTWNVLSSMGLCVVLLIFLGLLTFFGTLEQTQAGLFEVQKRYFESFFLTHEVAGIPIPLPGGMLVQGLLFVNIVLGGIVRMRKSTATLGVLITHVGILLLLLAGFVKLRYSEDGHVTLFEDQSANFFESYYNWELAVIEPLSNGKYREHVVPQSSFVEATGDRRVTLVTPDLPFDLVVHHYMKNCRPRQKGPMFDVDVPVVDGAFLQEVPPAQEAEQNAAGLYVEAVHKQSGRHFDGLLWGLDRAPWSFEIDGKLWYVDLRHERYELPFTLRLDRFTKEDHPRTNMPRVFASDVTVQEANSSRQVKIEMNEPLRDQGLVFFQASWGPSNARPGDPLFSTLAVVRNPSDQWPLIGCIVIALGLVVHFGRKLVLYIAKEMKA